MPLDPTLVPALEKELEYAKAVSPGGQPPNPGRIAHIRAQIKLHRAGQYETADAEPAEPVEAPAANVEDARADAPAETTKA